MEPVMVMSPTSYKTQKDCARKSYLDSLNTKGNIHFDYGHAYGHSASMLFKYVDKVKEVRLGAAYAAMFAYSKNFESLEAHYANKTLPKLIEGLRATDFMIQLLSKEFEYLDEEIKIILKVTPKNRATYILSGTYDVRVKNKITGLYSIFDFKAVSGDYLYSWETDPQVSIYSVLNQAVSDKLNLGYEYDARGKYLVHYTKNSNDVFAVRSVDPAFWKYNMVATIKDFMKLGKENQKLSNESQNIQELLVKAGTNPYQCNKNNYKCVYYERCYQHKFEDNVGFDDRRPTKVIVLECTEEDILKAANKIADRVVLTKVEDVDNVMSTEDMGMGFDSITELDLETEGTIIDTLLDI